MNLQILGYFGSRHDASGCGIVVGLHSANAAARLGFIIISEAANRVRARRLLDRQPAAHRTGIYGDVCAQHKLAVRQRSSALDVESNLLGGILW